MRFLDAGSSSDAGAAPSSSPIPKQLAAMIASRQAHLLEVVKASAGHLTSEDDKKRGRGVCVPMIADSCINRKLVLPSGCAFELRRTKERKLMRDFIIHLHRAGIGLLAHVVIRCPKEAVKRQEGEANAPSGPGTVALCRCSRKDQKKLRRHMTMRFCRHPSIASVQARRFPSSLSRHSARPSAKMSWFQHLKASPLWRSCRALELQRLRQLPRRAYTGWSACDTASAGRLTMSSELCRSQHLCECRPARPAANDQIFLLLPFRRAPCVSACRSVTLRFRLKADALAC